MDEEIEFPVDEETNEDERLEHLKMLEHERENEQ